MLPDLLPLRTRLVAEHHARPQDVARIMAALEELAGGLAILAALGHQFHLEPGPPVVGEHEWPRVMFHITSAPNGRLVGSRWDLMDLGGSAEGWYETLEAAQHADGVRAQFAGRGGIQGRALPVVVGPVPGPDRTSAEDRAARAARIAEWKLNQKKEPSHG